MSNTKPPVLVFGATGRVGGQAVKQLIEMHTPVVAAVRSLDKAQLQLPSSPYLQVMQADLTDTLSLTSVIQQTKATRVFLYVVGDDGMKRQIDTLISAGVRHIVLLSSFTVQQQYLAADDYTAHRHANVEGAIRSHAGIITYTFIRGGGFASNIFTWWRHAIHAEQPISIIGQDGFYVSAITEEDMGAIAVRALTSDALNNQAVSTRGPQMVTQRQQLAMMSQVWQYTAHVRSISEHDWRQMMASRMPLPVIESILRIAVSRDADKEGDVEETRRALGREPTDFTTYLKIHRHEFDLMQPTQSLH